MEVLLIVSSIKVSCGLDFILLVRRDVKAGLI